MLLNTQMQIILEFHPKPQHFSLIWILSSGNLFQGSQFREPPQQLPTVPLLTPFRSPPCDSQPWFPLSLIREAHGALRSRGR